MVKSAESFPAPFRSKAAKKRPTALGRNGRIPYVPMLDAVTAARSLPKDRIPFTRQRRPPASETHLNS